MLLQVMRIFFALDVSPSTKMAVSDWRDKSFRELAGVRPVSPGNFHITLAFIGEVAATKLEGLCDDVDQLLGRGSVEAGNLVINELGYWQRQGILWLGPRHCPGQFSQLADGLKGLATRVGGKRDNRLFKPHITLFRRCKSPPPPPLDPPDFSLSYREFILLESRQNKRGVSYHAVASWQLNPSLNTSD